MTAPDRPTAPMTGVEALREKEPRGREHVRSYRGHCLTHGKDCRYFATDPRTAREALDWCLDYIVGMRNRTRPPEAEPFFSERLAGYRALAAAAPPAEPEGLDREPETYCHRCGGPNRVWYAPSPLWNEVMRGGDINGPWKWNEIICPTCFMVLAEDAGIARSWRLDARKVLVPLSLVTPSGRVWDADQDLWVELLPPADAGDGLARDLITLIRIGFLDGSDRAERVLGQLGPSAHDLLLTILGAEDVAAAIRAARRSPE